MTETRALTLIWPGATLLSARTEAPPFSKLMPSYHVPGLWEGILGSLVIMAVNWAIGARVGATVGLAARAG